MNQVNCRGKYEQFFVCLNSETSLLPISSFTLVKNNILSSRNSKVNHDKVESKVEFINMSRKGQKNGTSAQNVNYPKNVDSQFPQPGAAKGRGGGNWGNAPPWTCQVQGGHCLPPWLTRIKKHISIRIG